MPDAMPITASFVLSEEEIKTVRAAFVERPRNSWITAIVLMVITAVLFTYSILSGRIRVDWETFNLPSLGLITVFCVALYFYFRWQRRETERKAIREDPATNRRIELQFSPDGVSSRIEGLSQTIFPWTGFIRVRRLAQGILFYQGRTTCVWVPEHAFASKGDAQAVAALAKERIANYSER